MNFKVKQMGIVGGVISIPLPVEETAPAMALMNDIQNGKTLSVEIKRYSPKRSLDANAYLWQVLTDIAAAIKSDKYTVYHEMLIRYGTAFTQLGIRKDAVDKFKAEWGGAVKEIGSSGDFVYLQCYAGSSTYDSKEFSILLDGVLDEAKALGLSYINKADRALLLSDWGSKRNEAFSK